MKKWLCIQNLVKHQEVNDLTVKVDIETIIRQVKADSKPEAIGKFLLATVDEERGCVKKLDVKCTTLKSVETIK